jgi:hypothetical protein
MTHWTEEEIGRGLAAVALESGNTRQAANALKSVVDKVHERIAERHMSLAEAQLELSADLTAELRNKKGKLEARDLSAAIRNLDVGSGIHTDKAQNIRAGAELPINLPDVQETLRSLRASGVTNIRLEMVDDAEEESVPGTATEVPEPWLPSGD